MPHTMRNDLLHRLATEALTFGGFTLPSGKKTNYHFNCKPVVESEEGSRLVGALCALTLMELSDERWPNAIGGLEGSAHLITRAAAKDLKTKWMRKMGVFKVKKVDPRTPLKKLIPSPPPPRSKVAIFDDVLATGAVIQRAIDAVNARKSHVAAIVVLIDRQDILDQMIGLTVRERLDARLAAFEPA